eukprot:6204677-Pleurochrysis_carterae.AAC.2
MSTLNSADQRHSHRILYSTKATNFLGACLPLYDREISIKATIIPEAFHRMQGLFAGFNSSTHLIPSGRRTPQESFPKMT